MSTLLNIFQQAADNSESLSKQFATFKKGVDATQLETVLNFLEENLVFSINFASEYFEPFITEDFQYKNAYERCKTIEEAEKHFAGRKKQRIGFEKIFENGKKFKYAALNCGTIGLPINWGPYCVHFDMQEYFKNCKCVILKRNSLQKDIIKKKAKFYYFEEDTVTIKIGKLQSELSTSELINQLVCLKMKESALSKENMIDLICNDNECEYIEFIFLDGDLQSYVKSVYIWKDYLDEQMEKILKKKPSRGKTREENEITRISKLLRNVKNMKLEVK